MAAVSTLALVVTAMLLGSMLFFAAVAAPAVFRFLPGEAAGRYLGGVFPRYYLWGAALAVLAALLAAPASGPIALVLAAVAAAFVLVRQVLVPRIEAVRAGRARGEEAATGRFRRLHRLSVLVNLAQMLTLVAAIAALAAVGP